MFIKIALYTTLVVPLAGIELAFSGLSADVLIPLLLSYEGVMC